MNEKLLQARLKNSVYRLGYALLGEKSGGLITTLLKRKGSLFDTLECLADAAKSGNARDYIGGVLRKSGDDLNNKCKVGDRMGNYEWDGSKWKEFEESRVRRNDEVAAKHGYHRDGENYVQTTET